MGTPYGLQAMLKEGHKTFSGVEEAVLKNIDACKGLSAITRTSLGPNGALRGDANIMFIHSRPSAPSIGDWRERAARVGARKLLV